MWYVRYGLRLRSGEEREGDLVESKSDPLTTAERRGEPVADLPARTSPTAFALRFRFLSALLSSEHTLSLRCASLAQCNVMLQSKRNWDLNEFD